MQATNWWQGFRASLASPFLSVLVGVDGLFILLHFLQATPLFSNPLFTLNRDQGYAEIYLYGKELLIAALLLALLIRTRVAGYGLWALLFLYLVVDDALQIHERFGVFVATNVAFISFLGLRAQDVGELAVYGMVATVLLLALTRAYQQGTAAFQEATRHLLLLLLALAFFGVVVDMVLIVLNLGWKIDYILVVVEDGGEMVVMSFIAWYVYHLNQLVHIRHDATSST